MKSVVFHPGIEGGFGHFGHRSASVAELCVGVKAIVVGLSGYVRYVVVGHHCSAEYFIVMIARMTSCWF